MKKVRLAPIPDLRPTSIDRIDILRYVVQWLLRGREISVILFLFQTSEPAQAATQTSGEKTICIQSGASDTETPARQARQARHPDCEDKGPSWSLLGSLQASSEQSGQLQAEADRG